jgi:hypothetical protein
VALFGDDRGQGQLPVVNKLPTSAKMLDFDPKCASVIEEKRNSPIISVTYEYAISANQWD